MVFRIEKNTFGWIFLTPNKKKRSGWTTSTTRGQSDSVQTILNSKPAHFQNDSFRESLSATHAMVLNSSTLFTMFDSHLVAYSLTMSMYSKLLLL